MQTDRQALPPLTYDPAWYNLVVHVRNFSLYCN
jgi:hypothetical protein